MANFTVKVCYPNWLKIACIVCHVVSYSSRTERLLTRQSWLKNGLPPTAVNSSEKTNGHQTHRTSTLLAIISVELCFNAKNISTQAKYHRRAEESLAVHMGRSATLLYQQVHTEHRQKLRASVKAGAGHFEHVLRKTVFTSQSFELVASDVFFLFRYKHCDENCDFHSQCFTW